MGDGNRGISERWSDFRPSKALWLWSCVGVAALTMIVGFTYGGWVTGGTATEMADNAAQKARAQIVASVCVERFVNADQFATRLSKLKEASSWDREDVITEGHWAELDGVEGSVDDAADLCANNLAEMKTPTKETMKSNNKTPSKINEPKDTSKKAAS